MHLFCDVDLIQFHQVACAENDSTAAGGGRCSRTGVSGSILIGRHAMHSLLVVIRHGAIESASGRQSLTDGAIDRLGPAWSRAEGVRDAGGP